MRISNDCVLFYVCLRVCYIRLMFVLRYIIIARFNALWVEAKYLLRVVICFYTKNLLFYRHRWTFVEIFKLTSLNCRVIGWNYYSYLTSLFVKSLHRKLMICISLNFSFDNEYPKVIDPKKNWNNNAEGKM